MATMGTTQLRRIKERSWEASCPHHRSPLRLACPRTRRRMAPVGLRRPCCAPPASSSMCVSLSSERCASSRVATCGTRWQNGLTSSRGAWVPVYNSISRADRYREMPAFRRKLGCSEARSSLFRAIIALQGATHHQRRSCGLQGHASRRTCLRRSHRGARPASARCERTGVYVPLLAVNWRTGTCCSRASAGWWLGEVSTAWRQLGTLQCQHRTGMRR